MRKLKAQAAAVIILCLLGTHKVQDALEAIGIVDSTWSVWAALIVLVVLMVWIERILKMR